MYTIRLLDLGDVSPLRSQTVYHAAEYALRDDGADTILLVSPTQPYVSIGYHQELEKEVDLDTCRQRNLPIIRREVGGGAVYLDHGQLFVQWVFHPSHLPEKIEDRFALYVRPIVETYHELGIDAEYRPINDIHVNGRKICGTGAATIGNAEVVVGSFMFHFDKETMSRVLRVSSEKMRDKVFQSLQQYMTTIEDLLGYQPSRDLVKQIYLDKTAKLLNTQIRPGEWSAEEEAQACEVEARFQSEEWLYQRGGLRQSGVKIHQDVRVVEGGTKAPGGLVRATLRLRHGRIDDIVLSGDFTLAPAFALAALEQSLRGLTLAPDALTTRVQQVYKATGIQSPGLAPDHFVQAILAAAGAS